MREMLEKCTEVKIHMEHSQKSNGGNAIRLLAI